MGDTSAEIVVGGPKRKRWDAVLSRLPVDRPLVGVEVGVYRGLLSRILLAERRNLTLYMVDPWRTGTPGTPWMDSGSVCPRKPQSDFDQARKRALSTTKPWADRRRVMRMASVTAAALCAEHGDRFDFVFIDGDHSFEGCLADIQAWAPLVKPGGIVSGHDWAKEERGRVTEAVLAYYPRDRVEVDAESTWFVRV